MKVLGIDPGLNKTGWAVLELFGNNFKCINSGVIKPKAIKGTSERLFNIYNGLKDIIVTNNPSCISLEETFINKNPKGSLQLGYARGIALMVPSIFSLPVFEYSPNTVKKTVTGAGHASKEQVIKMVKLIFPSTSIGIESDEADAMAIALCHLYHSGSKIFNNT